MTQITDGRLSRHEAAALASASKDAPTLKSDLRNILDWLDAKAPAQAYKEERKRLRAWLKYGTYIVAGDER
ncbi:hypothetical protein [Rhizobium sp. BK456]|uniref:hypothetical protein n=1 Tax=Rhizobium sp. BK456 TaxID=2587007 RepID=UPI00161412B2|nr:hypothetical protein [Rhizobium sp. BK456]MBB3521105.1 hypothetical protein [Rhizobium sp. BK456]